MRHAVVLSFCAAVVACDAESPAPPAAAPRSFPFPSRGEPIVLVGSGAMTPLALKLAEAWARGGHVPRLNVEASVGSGGGIRAAVEGAVDLGLVSRPLRPSERALGLDEVNVARDLVVFASNARFESDGLTSTELLDLYWDRRASSNDGAPVTVLLRDREESANDAIEVELPGLRPAREQAYESHRFRVLYHDDSMGEVLAATPGGIGVFSLGAIKSWGLPLKALSVDGVVPSAGSVEVGSWRAVRPLTFVVRADHRARVRELVAFVLSPAGREVVTANGYLLPSTEASR